MPQPFDIICVQDPPRDFAFGSFAPYNLWHDAGRELTELDNPYFNPGSMPSSSKREDRERMRKRVAFFVHNSSDWRVTTYNNQNRKLVASLELTTASDQIAIHNVYKRSQKVSIDRLAATCMGRDCDILLGDFNLHPL